ncbi:carbohydrate ABC transporter permease [Paenibacillus sp. WQ 127069]|uniref:Carbohydrate ABC transporter permease n=1 Tax=Paenibacillus baimaensis TaxID=2982185 RepID=A0ABT2UGL9_9BACL|nr:carbohydrate ABC transporter permease [Paenibacillus sp. WQ 127069]MCU6793032.1 carbohydrate ABC transporter permease [Paenibacillus sp. WQ 127069]
MKRNIRGWTFDFAVTSILTFAGVITIIPFLYIVLVSFATPSEYIQKAGAFIFPTEWTLVNYQYLLSTGAFIQAGANSAFLAIVGTVLSLAVTSSFAYALSRRRLRGRKTLLLLVLISILFNPGIIPPYLVVKSLGLINSIWSLIIPALTSGWYIFLMKSFYDSIPVSLEEAASIDGCNDMGIWVKIILPLSLPSLAAFGLFYAVSYWNVFFHAILYINDFDKWPLQVLLQNMLIDSSTSGGDLAIQIASEQEMPKETLKMAAVVVATVPIILVYPFLQKHFAKGVMVGSVKE